MFWNWFSPKCPLDLSSKVWIESRYQTLASRMRGHPARTRQILDPCSPEYRQLISGTGGLDAVAAWVVERLSVEPGIDFKVVPDATLNKAVGTYQQGARVVRIAHRVLETPEILLGVVIHEALHDFLLRGKFLTGEEEDHERMTDLAAVLTGLAVPLANMTIHDKSWHDGQLSWWEIQRVGYLTSQEFGYGIALDFAIREQPLPDWSRVLRRDANETFAHGLRFLSRTGDHSVRSSSRGEVIPHDGGSYRQFLSTGTPSQKLATLWAIVENVWQTDEGPVFAAMLLDEADAAPEVRLAAAWIVLAAISVDDLPRLSKLCVDFDPEISAHALSVLCELDGHDSDLRKLVAGRLPDFHALARDDNPRVRAYSIRSLGRFAPDDHYSRALVDKGMSDSSKFVIDSSLFAAHQAGRQDEYFKERLYRRIREAAFQVEDDALRQLIEIVDADGEAEAVINKVFARREDHAYHRAAMAILGNSRRKREDATASAESRDAGQPGSGNRRIRWVIP